LPERPVPARSLLKTRTPVLLRGGTRDAARGPRTASGQGCIKRGAPLFPDVLKGTPPQPMQHLRNQCNTPGLRSRPRQTRTNATRQGARLRRVSDRHAWPVLDFDLDPRLIAGPQRFPNRDKVDNLDMKLLLVVELFIFTGWVAYVWGPDVYRSWVQRRKRRGRLSGAGLGPPFSVPEQRAASRGPRV